MNFPSLFSAQQKINWRVNKLLLFICDHTFINLLSTIKFKCAKHQKATLLLHNHVPCAKLVCGFLQICVDLLTNNGRMSACMLIVVTWVQKQTRHMLSASIVIAAKIAPPESGNANYWTGR